MAPKFGTSGLRGLVAELTPELIAHYVRAFVSARPIGKAIFVGQDLRPSSPRIAQDVIAAARALGCDVVDCGAVPTPALALAATAAGASAIMVTGSHIPADRNGLKFYLPGGEISKEDEAAIIACLADAAAKTDGPQAALASADVGAGYLARYLHAYGPAALSGLRLGIYQHSSVARDLLPQIAKALGADVVELARSETFIPVDTEAVPAETRAQLVQWAQEHRLDAILSTDGDADRPLLTDETGAVIPGDILGLLSAQALGAKIICTPISTNTQVHHVPGVEAVHLTRIGSPYVIAAMEAVRAATPQAKVVGFEANGGFLLGYCAQGPAGPLDTLMTRDAVLPLIAPLVQARAEGVSLGTLRASFSARVTAADRLENMPPEASAAFLARLSASFEARAEFLSPLAPEASAEQTDGLRLSLADGRIIHLRPSGNAPEFRVYVEASSQALAQSTLSQVLDRVKSRLGGG